MRKRWEWNVGKRSEDEKRRNRRGKGREEERKEEMRRGRVYNSNII
jgi:hypothetical protein